MSDRSPLVSIVVDNHNYGRFLGASIDSALGQSYGRCEVIVVDDGSTDDSRDIVARYGDRIRAILKEQGGQASALNAGFRAARGDIVVVLDADDVLAPDTVGRVVDAFSTGSGIARVHYRLEMVDEAGRPLGRSIPRPGLPLAHGDCSRAVLRYPDDLIWAPMSGNAFSAEVLARVLPIPTEVFPTVGADVYLLGTNALFGKVLALDSPGGSYRVHGTNAYHADGLDLEGIKQMVVWSDRTHAAIDRLAPIAGVPPDDVPVGARSLTLIASRMILARLSAHRGDLATVGALRLVGRGIACALGRRDLPFRRRAIYVAWLGAMALAPRALAARLADAYVRPGRSIAAAHGIGVLSGPMDRLRRALRWGRVVNGAGSRDFGHASETRDHAGR